jgi:hypothetical protein
MLEPKYYLPPPDLIDAVNNEELIFFVIGYVNVSPFVLVEWAAGLDEASAIIGESLYRDGQLLIAQSGNELRQSLARDILPRSAKAGLSSLESLQNLVNSAALDYGLSKLELTRLNDPSNFTLLKIV